MGGCEDVAAMQLPRKVTAVKFYTADILVISGITVI